MMQAIRGRVGSIVVKILFGLLIVSFGLWGIADYAQDKPTQDSVIATVGDQSIRAADLQKAIEPALERMRTQFGSGIDSQQLKQLGVVDTLLSQLIDRSLLDQEAKRLGLEVSDDVIRGAIYDNPAFRGPDGKFDRRMFTQVLSMNRLSEEQLVARLRHDIPRADLVQAITAGVSAPQPVVDVLYRYRHEKRVADIVSFSVSAIADTGPPSEADLTQFHEAHSDLFRAPEYRAFTVASLSPADMKQAAEIPEDKLRKEYELRKDDYESLEQREIQQILSPSEAKANEAAAAVASGKEWKEVATSIAGQDPETVELGLLNRKEIPQELGDIAFELPLNEVSRPIKTPLGWHILRIVRIEPAAAQGFDDVKAKLAVEMQLQDAADRLSKLGNQADDALAGGGKLDEVAAKYGLTLTSVAAVDETGHDPDGKPVTLPVVPDEILKSAFATGPGETGRVADTQDGSVFAIRVDKVTPPQTRPLAEVKDKAIAGWQAEQKRQAATKQAEDLAALANAETSLAKAAGDKGLTLLAAVSLTRAAQPGQRVPAALVAKLFAAKPGDVVTVSDASGAHTAQLKDIQAPEAISEAEAAKLADQLVAEAKLDIAGEFTQALRRRFPVEIKRTELDRMF